MQYSGAIGSTVTVMLTAEECELIADGVADSDVGMPRIEQSISAQLADDFRALARVARMTHTTPFREGLR